MTHIFHKCCLSFDFISLEQNLTPIKYYNWTSNKSTQAADVWNSINKANKELEVF